MPYIVVFPQSEKSVGKIKKMYSLHRRLVGKNVSKQGRNWLRKVSVTESVFVLESVSVSVSAWY
jgi:hypothetical protein